MSDKYYEGVGRRKESSARVRLVNGSGQITVNGKPGDVYFGRDGDLQTILQALTATNQDLAQFDISMIINGGGVTGQRDAGQLGLARALLSLNPDFRSPLRKAGMLTRDARIKERKKPGLKRARKAPTYTKR
ncbi:MAG TPA: 30S ribosomal protein S9 [Anaerolineales bacterium]|nr:30S ribosomal protein S9 [Anaerolineales bacterium]